MNCIECPWFESCDELDESYCINDELNRVKTELEECEDEYERCWQTGEYDDQYCADCPHNYECNGEEED